MTDLHRLSGREQEVVNLVLDGKSNKMIASALNISLNTVEFHLKNIYAKLEIASRVELIIKLRESTVASEGEPADNRNRLNLRSWSNSVREAISKIGKELSVENANTAAQGQESTMTFIRSIEVCLRKYATFDGRASRPEFWWFALFVTLSGSALALLSGVIVRIFLIGMLLPLLAAGTRRLRDSGKSGWWQLFLLVPAAGIVVVGFLWALPPARPLPEDNSVA